MHDLRKIIATFVLGGMLTAAAVLAGVGEASAEDFEQKKACSKLSKPGHYPDYERLPKFQIARQELDESKPPIVLLRITVSPNELAKGSEVRLACRLIEDFGRNSSVDVLVFDDAQAAKNLALGFPEQTNYGGYLWHLRAHLQWNVNTQEGKMRYVTPSVRDDLLALDTVTISISR